ncbi:hypothetical protein H5410_005925 [Solanum commersonii]|uniref:Uncharacterized protein n=1 Tax=Solanum commersonii TaxID=4109 RepID=A0A9J6A8U5_SOLCO|nr:hypothetical protein H5410_005925 [Solanum commersonii]
MAMKTDLEYKNPLQGGMFYLITGKRSSPDTRKSQEEEFNSGSPLPQLIPDPTRAGFQTNLWRSIHIETFYPLPNESSGFLLLARIPIHRLEV